MQTRDGGGDTKKMARERAYGVYKLPYNQKVVVVPHTCLASMRCVGFKDVRGSSCPYLAVAIVPSLHDKEGFIQQTYDLQGRYQQVVKGVRAQTL